MTLSKRMLRSAEASLGASAAILSNKQVAYTLAMWSLQLNAEDVLGELIESPLHCTTLKGSISYGCYFKCGSQWVMEQSCTFYYSVKLWHNQELLKQSHISCELAKVWSVGLSEDHLQISTFPSHSRIPNKLLQILVPYMAA